MLTAATGTAGVWSAGDVEGQDSDASADSDSDSDCSDDGYVGSNAAVLGPVLQSSNIAPVLSMRTTGRANAAMVRPKLNTEMSYM